MKVAVLTAPGPVHVYLCHQLAQRVGVCGIIQVDEGPSATTADGSRWARVRRAPLETLRRRVRRIVAGRRNRGVHADVRRTLFAGGEPPALPDIVRVPRREINGARGIAALRDLEPRCLVVSGGPLLKEPFFTLPTFGTVNIHWGIAPYYRGTECLFWPLYYGDWQHVGVTLHYIDKGIDTGTVLGQAWPALEPSDTEGTIAGKCARMAVDLVVAFLEEAEQGRPAGKPQAEGGRLFLKRQRTAWHDVSYAVRLRLGHRPPVTQARVVKHF